MKDHYPAPISLNPLVAIIGVDAVHEAALKLGALEIAAKQGQVWRCVLDGAIIIGYKTTAVIAGRDTLTMERAAALLQRDESNGLEARAFDLAYAVRQTLGRRDEALIIDVIARCLETDEATYARVEGILAHHAADTGMQFHLLSRIYMAGFSEGYNTALVIDEDDADDHFLPDAPIEALQ